MWYLQALRLLEASRTSGKTLNMGGSVKQLHKTGVKSLELHPTVNVCSWHTTSIHNAKRNSHDPPPTKHNVMLQQTSTSSCLNLTGIDIKMEINCERNASILKIHTCRTAHKRRNESKTFVPYTWLTSAICGTRIMHGNYK